MAEEQTNEQTISLLDQIKQVALGREQLQKFHVSKKESYDKWQESNKELLETISVLEEAQIYAEDYLRYLTIKAYQETGSKNPAPGVGIREITKLVYDPKEAFEYAKEHGIALKLDTSSFDKMAKIPELRPGFVGVKQEVQATIATDLSAVLEAE